MSARPGEDNVATLFGDVHYFYGPETDNPPHHRFNKGSYVYLFEDASEGRARIEIANRPGTEQQDAFDGYLHHTSVSYTYKHSCMVSLAVNHIPGPAEWHLPTWDPHNQAIYHYPLRSLDIYFWTPRDALLFVNGVRRVLPDAQLNIEDEPAPMPVPPPPPPVQPAVVQQPASLSHVVQKLENVALSGGGSGRGSVGSHGSAGRGSAGTGSGSAAPSAVPSFAPPPQAPVDGPTNPPPPPTTAPAAPAAQQPQAQAQAQQQPAFTPFVYNPAAPPAPETIRPREKTPPPEEFAAAGAHPLHQTLAYDAATPFSPGLVVPAGVGPLSPGVPPPQFHALPTGVPSFPGPPVYTGGSSDHPSLARAATMPAVTTSAAAASPFGPMFLPPPTTAAAAPAVSTAPPVQATPLAQAPLQAHPSAAVGIAGYSQYNYTTAPAPAAAAGLGAGISGYAVHQQLYRPTEGEAAVVYKPKQEPRGKLEEVGGRLDKGVTGVLKRFEKRFG